MSTISKILNAGVYPGMLDRDRIAIVTANVQTFVLLFITSLWAVVVAFMGLIPLMVLHIIMAFLALILHISMHVANPRLVKAAIMLLTAAYFFVICVLVGWGSGVEFYGSVILVSCLLLFPDRSQSVTWLMLGLTTAIVLGAYIAMFVFDPFIIVSDTAHAVGYPLIVLLLLPTTLILLAVFQRQSRQMEQRLEKDRDKAVQIVSNVLPEIISQRLQQGQVMIADSHGGATVLFADIVGFTTLTSRLAPEQLVHSLNELFSKIDEFAQTHGIEKIKTIGDCYMAACGVLDEVNDPANMIEFAKELRSTVHEFSDTLGYPLDVRVGIGYGQVISGVIGREKKTFDLWGETVNLASRMESTGESGRIQVTESLYWRLRNVYEFEERLNTEVKGVGLVNTYFLVEPDLAGH